MWLERHRVDGAGELGVGLELLLLLDDAPVPAPLGRPQDRARDDKRDDHEPGADGERQSQASLIRKTGVRGVSACASSSVPVGSLRPK